MQLCLKLVARARRGAAWHDATLKYKYRTFARCASRHERTSMPPKQETKKKKKKKKKKAPGSKRAMAMLAEAQRLNRLASPKATAAASPVAVQTPPAAAAAATAAAASPAGADLITPPGQILPQPVLPPPVRRQDMVAWLTQNADGGLGGLGGL